MSYEGYVVFYCECGYKRGSWDCYDTPDTFSPCPYCGSTKVLHDSVNETNGCECDELLANWEGNIDTDDPPMCSCHETITEDDIIGSFGQEICPCCKGTGKRDIPKYDVSKLIRK